MDLSLGREPAWSRTPPALGPVCLGLLACGLGWRRAAGALGAPSVVGELWIGAALGLLALCLGMYLLKIAARPGSLAFDLRMPAGRGAVPAFTMALMFSGAALAPLAPALATAVWGAGVIGHVALAALLARELIAAPPEGRPVTASLLVPFAGQVAAPIAGAPLGLPWVSGAMMASAVLAYVVIAPLAVRRLLTHASPPPPMRAATFILLAPPSVAVAAWEALDPGAPGAAVLYAISCVILCGLLVRLPWIAAGGWSPAWGAFTFPSAAFASATLVMAARGIGPVWDGAAAMALTAACLVTLYVAGRAGMAWAQGKLAAR